MRKAFSIILCVVMCLGMFTNVFAVDISNNCTGIEDAAVVRAIAPSTVTSTEKDGRTCVEIKTDSTQGVTGANDPYIVYEYTDCNDRYYEFSVDMMLEDNLCDRNIIMWLNSPNDAPILIRPVSFTKNKRIGYKKENGTFVDFKNPKNFENGKWYNIKVEIDTINASGNIYVDGEKMNQEQIVFNATKALGGIKRLRFVNQDTSNIIAKTYIDTFSFIKKDEIENYVTPIEVKAAPLIDLENYIRAESIFKLNELGIIDGYTDKSFCPENNVKFNSFIKMVVKALDPNISNGAEYWAKPYIDEAVKRNIINEDDAIDPERAITYKEISSILANALNEEAIVDEEKYSRYIKNYSQIPDEYKKAIIRTFSKGITLTNTENEFVADSNISRGQAAEMLLRFLYPSKRISVKYTIGIYASESFKNIAQKIINGASDEYTVCMLSKEDMDNPELLNTNVLDCIMLLNDVSETDAAKKNLKEFLYNGGDFLTAGSELFTKFNNSDWKLPIYEGYNYNPYDLEGTKRVVTAKHQQIITKDIKVIAEEYYGGTSAVGFLFPNQSVFIPVLSAENEYSQSLGHAAGILVQYDGKYEGGKWLIFGIENEEFYANNAFYDVVFDSLEKFRGDELDKAYSKEKIKQQNIEAFENYKITQPKAEGSVKVDKETGKLIGLDGKELFIIGANTFGDAEYLLGMGNESDGSFSVEKIENIFRIASEHGVNCIRFWKLPTEGKRVDIIKDLARKYKIYLYPHIGITNDREKDLENVEKYARAYGDEPMVIGYDLMNEPNFIKVMTRFDGEESPLIQADIYGNCKEYMEKWKVSYDWLNDDANLAYMGWYEYMSPELRKQIVAADIMYRKELFEGSATMSLTKIKLKENLNEEQKIAFDAINSTIEKWIETRKEIIRKYDPDALVTVGNYDQLNLFPANSKLDFQNLHAYTVANTQDDMKDALAAFDGLNKRFPSSATMFGEFCYSGGQILKSGPHKGELADYDVANAGEFMHWLYAYSKGYAGAVIWALQEWNPANYRYDNPQYGLWEPANGLRRERQGLLYYAGNVENKYKAKPVASATKFFSEHLNNHSMGEGTLAIVDSDNQINFGFVYESETSKYVAATSHTSEKLSFNSERTPIVMMDWSEGEIHIMATINTTVTINPSKCINGLTASNAKIEGLTGATQKKDNKIVIELLKDSVVTIK